MAKVMISVPDDLLDTIDRAADQAGQTRSAFVRDALRRRLAEDHERRRSEFRRRARRRSGTEPWPGSPEHLVRAERDR